MRTRKFFALRKGLGILAQFAEINAQEFKQHPVVQIKYEPLSNECDDINQMYIINADGPSNLIAWLEHLLKQYNLIIPESMRIEEFFQRTTPALP